MQTDLRNGSAERTQRTVRNTVARNEAFVDAARLARWASEASFFDRLADAQTLQPLPKEIIERYRRAARPWYDKEFRFRLLGDLRGLRVLDVGCGDGTNALLLAHQGAHVLGVDVSPKSIALCRRRAEIEGLARSLRFECSPLESIDLPEGVFDVVWGDGILHHVIPELDVILPRLKRAARSGGCFVFSEPVAVHPWIRRIRMHVPVHTDATPGERPLGREELAILRQHFPDLEMRPFSALGRFTRFALHGPYEKASRLRQAVVDALHLIDYALLRVPGLSGLGSMFVLTARA